MDRHKIKFIHPNEITLFICANLCYLLCQQKFLYSSIEIRKYYEIRIGQFGYRLVLIRIANNIFILQKGAFLKKCS